MPGHVLVCPRRPAPRLTDLTTDEVTDVYLTVQRVARMLERVYSAPALNIAMQDGVDAGQTVPHLHVHLIPRKKQDLPPDAIYGMMEGEEGNMGRQWAEREKGSQGKLEYWERPRPKFDAPKDEDRRERTEQVMREEADMLAREMEKEKL